MKNPYTVARLEGIEVIEEPLGNVYGYYNEVDGQKFIHINEDVPEYFQRYIVAHMLYPALNNIKGMQFLKEKVSNKYLPNELKANKFALELMLDEEERNEPIINLLKKYKLREDEINDLEKRLFRVLGIDLHQTINNTYQLMNKAQEGKE